MPLSDRDKAILDLEGCWWRYPGAKATAIEQLGLTEPRFYQILSALIESREALEYAPLTVKRALRLRDLRRARRRA